MITVIIELVLLGWSAPPLLLMQQEKQAGQSLDNRYTIEHTDYVDRFPSILKKTEVTVNGQKIEVVERPTGLTAAQTSWEYAHRELPGEIFKLQVKVNGRPAAEPSEITIPKRERGARYFSWLDVLQVTDRKTGTSEAVVVQRTSMDDTPDDTPDDKREWRLQHVDQAGGIKEETVTYPQRSGHPLAVRLINISGTSLMSLGYHSDILLGYPSRLFPLLYPWFSGAVGVLILLGSLPFLLRTTRNTNQIPS